jgi:outer membrane protein OmpA-like peptidoglycan-associated protein
MQEFGMQLELPEQASPSIWPWIIGATAAVLLLINFIQLTDKIPRSLYAAAQSTISSAGANGALLSIDGRDLVLSGTISQSVDRDALASTLNNIDGIRIVEDNMSTFDPQKAQQQAQLQFTQSLANIDFSRVAFEPGSVSLTRGSETALVELVQLLNSNPQFRIRVAGHTDNTGRPEVNLRISKQRAQAVASFLFQQRVSRDQVIAQGYGATRPIADNQDEAGRARNRRIEINFID